MSANYLISISSLSELEIGYPTVLRGNKVTTCVRFQLKGVTHDEAKPLSSLNLQMYLDISQGSLIEVKLFHVEAEVVLL